MFIYLEQESELQSVIDTPASQDSSERRCSLGGLDGLVSKPHLSVDISSLYPSRGQAAQLWQVYLNNVDVLVKVLHIPTIQPAIFAAINNQSQVSPDLSALLFSIYFAAVTSLRREDTHVMLGQDWQSALQRYQRGLETSLHMASFLDSPTITFLQAMSIYLVNMALSLIPHVRYLAHSQLFVAVLSESQR